MSRAVVLVLCLAAAGGIAIYTHYSGGADTSGGADPGEPVYTVPIPPAEPASPSPAPAPLKRIHPGDRAALTRELQRELQRVGCYDGKVTGVWTTSSRMAMKAFVERVNAALPVDEPDPVLLSLVQGHRERACGAACPDGETAVANGACVPTAVLAETGKDSPPGDKSAAAAATAAAAAGAATAAAARASKADPGAAATAPEAAKPAGARRSGPVPPEGMARRRPRRSAPPPRPPKVVRDFLRALGFK